MREQRSRLHLPRLAISFFALVLFCLHGAVAAPSDTDRFGETRSEALLSAAPAENFEVDYSQSEGALSVEFTNVMSTGGSVSGNLRLLNARQVWYKVYVETVGEVDLDQTELFLDDGGYYLLLGPGQSSDEAIGALPSTVTFNTADSGIFFRADRTAEAGDEASLLMVIEALNQVFGFDYLPTADFQILLDIIDTPVFTEKAIGFGLLGLFDATLKLMEFIREEMIVVLFQDAYSEIGYNFAKEELREIFTFFDVIGALDVIVDANLAPHTDVVILKATGPGAAAVIDADVISGPAPALVQFDGTNSSGEGSIQGYEWNFRDGTTASGETVTHTFDEPGTYNVRLTVTDAEGNEDVVTRPVYVTAPRFTVTPRTPFTPRFEADQSDEVTAYEWEFGDGSTAVGRVVEHTYNESGEYDATLTLSLANGTTVESTRAIQIGPRPVYVTGDFEGDQVWPASQGPFVLEGTGVTVAEGATLTIEPGVEVILPSLDDLRIEGSLVAEATVEAPIRFRRPSDYDNDEYGGQLHFTSTSTASVLDHVIIEGLSGSLNTGGALNIEGTSAVELTNSTITDSRDSGLYLKDGAQPVVEENIFSGNVGADIRVRLANSLAQVGANDVPIITVDGTMSEAITWRVNEGTTYILEDVTVAEGATLTIEPGVEVILPSLDDLRIEGSLVAEATVEAPIRFRRPSDYDNDEYGGQLHFTSTSTASVLDHVIIEGLSGSLNTGGALNIEGTSAVELTNSTIADSRDSGLFLDDGASPVVRRSIFENNQVGVRISGEAAPDLGTTTSNGDNVFRNNTQYAVRNNSSQTIQAIGNFWNVTDAFAIDDIIYDDDERSSSGPVVFRPFLDELPNSSPQSGTTIIIHGANIGSDIDLNDDGLLGSDPDASWVHQMALTIQDRVEGQIYHLTDGQYEQIEPGNPDGEKILMFDWLEESVHPVFGYAEGAADALVALLLQGAQNDDWALDQLHFIGYSRGAVVASEAIQRLGLLTSTATAPMPVDESIHFTPLDPHPWDTQIEDFDSLADWVTAQLSAHDNEVNDMPGAGIVCWSNVAYADHYWQQQGVIDGFWNNLSGLSSVPGCAFSQSLNDETVSDEENGDEEVHHGNIHQWYIETINDNELSGGFDYARAAGELARENIRNNSSFAPEDDNTLDRSSFFNGDFDIARQYPIDVSEILADRIESLKYDWAAALASLILGVNYSRPEIAPGWSFHGGTGGLIGDICSLLPLSSDRAYCRYSPFNPKLFLDEGANWRRHNVQHVPQDASALHFTTFTFNTSDDDRLKVYFHYLSEGGLRREEIANYEISDRNYLRSTKRSADLPGSIRGTSGAFEFAIESSDGTVSSALAIDDVGFEENRRFLASVSLSSAGSEQAIARKATTSTTHGASVFLGAYDASGNYTGPTSDTSWVAEIPGSKFLIEDTTVTRGRHAIVLPALPSEEEYTFELTSQGETDAVNLFIEDHATPGQTGAAGYERVELNPNTVARTVIGSSTLEPVLEIDRDGDGNFESTQDPSDTSGTLPVEFSSFDATRDGEQVRLTWTTASESNNAGFEVQRQTEQFGSFRRIGYVSGSGTTTEATTYRFSDADLPFEAERIVYRLKQVDFDGTFEYSEEVELRLDAPVQLALHGNFPNPFAERTTIRYEVPKTGEVRLNVYNILGQRVTTLVEGRQEAGRKELTFDGSDLASGIYMIRLHVGGEVLTQKMSIVR